jgi:Mn-dependent DtxR family transcriptional regulator
MTDRDANLHNNYDWMHNAYVVEEKEVSEISKELHISPKLVLIKLKEHGLI